MKLLITENQFIYVSLGKERRWENFMMVGLEIIKIQPRNHLVEVDVIRFEGRNGRSQA